MLRQAQHERSQCILDTSHPARPFDAVRPERVEGRAANCDTVSRRGEEELRALLSREIDYGDSSMPEVAQGDERKTILLGISPPLSLRVSGHPLLCCDPGEVEPLENEIRSPQREILPVRESTQAPGRMGSAQPDHENISRPWYNLWE